MKDCCFLNCDEKKVRLLVWCEVSWSLHLGFLRFCVRVESTVDACVDVQLVVTLFCKVNILCSGLI